MPLSRILEITAWTAGALLLGTYVGVRAWSARASDEGVAALQAARVERELLIAQADHATTAAAAGSTSKNNLSVALPDTSLWDRKRIAEYKETLTHKDLPAGVLRVPRFKLQVPIYEGTSDFTLNRGAGWITGTADIDSETGNIGIAAHRDGFFRPLKDIKVGDEIFLDTLTATRQYRVTKLDIVDPSNVSVLAPTSAATITLVTCYPFYYVGSAPKRFIVRAEVEG
ncbi:MAG TPA: class D sortase [Povalibacter sp.]|nr:class D sortase [Povalibacter sp.]